METQKLLNADYLDILYDNRNKKYGGYDLRRNYANRAKRALYLVLLSTGMLSSIPVIAGILEGENVPQTPISYTQPTTIVQIIQPTEKPIIKPVAKDIQAAPIKATVAIRILKIVPNDQVVDDAPKSIDSLGDRTAGLNNNLGSKDGLVADNGQKNGFGKIPTDLPVIDKPAIEPVLVASEMPAFDGDLTAFLNHQIQYPEQARIRGEEGRTVVKFVVNEDGSISNAAVVATSKSKLLDAEAIRVVGAMPNWKPGKQQGKPVKVYFNLPITFKLD